VLDRPWVRLLLGALAAAMLGAMAARIAVSAGDPSGGSATAGRSSSGGGGSGDSRSGGSGSGSSASSEDGGSGGGATASLAAGSGRVTVHVTGEVRRPGVYGLREGARVDEAVRRAGGATAEGDRQGLNLAAPVRDGQQVRVPTKAAVAGSAGGAVPGGAEAGEGGAGGAAAGGAAGAGGAGAGGAPIDLNTATLEELQTLDGVGPTTAEKIVALREERGGLGGVDDLDEIPGIGAKKLEALRAQLQP